MRIKPLFPIHLAFVGFCWIITCWLGLGIHHIWEIFLLHTSQDPTWVSFVSLESVMRVPYSPLPLTR